MSTRRIEGIRRGVAVRVDRVPFLFMVSIEVYAAFYVPDIDEEDYSLDLGAVMYGARSSSQDGPLACNGVGYQDGAFSRVDFAIVITGVRLYTGAAAGGPIDARTVYFCNVTLHYVFFFLDERACENHYRWGGRWALFRLGLF